ncbi:MAG TPA: ferrochelatase [Candidatus Tectomicrobia bacterium]|nr:ferrochelatase [Candidatus Tectomicrobia bacterium]
MERDSVTASTTQTVGILLMAHGSPDHLDDMAAYLQHVRGGRPTPQALVDDIRGRYQLIGGRSPLLDLTRAQGKALETRLNAGSRRFRVYVGMRHWHPFIRDTVQQMADDGIRRIVALSMAPQYSRLSVGAYRRALETAQEELGVGLDVTAVTSWHDHPLLWQAFAESVQAICRQLSDEVRAQLCVIFTAHSLPLRILAEGDPYPSEVDRTAAGVAKRLGLTTWEVAYQSQGATPEPWLGPTLDEVFDRAAAQNRRALLIVPIGFVCDHVEILYDIDILAQKVAQEKGLCLWRTASLNTLPTFIEALASVVEAHL